MTTFRERLPRHCLSVGMGMVIGGIMMLSLPASATSVRAAATDGTFPLNCTLTGQHVSCEGDLPTASPTTPPPTTTPPATTTPPVTTPPATTPPATTPPMGGFPNAGNTGIPAGTVLAPAVTHLVITQPGTYSALHVTSDVEIRSSNVTLRYSRISCDSQCVHVDGGLTGVVISRNDLGMDSGFGSDPQGINVFGKGAANSVLIVGNHIHNVGDGIRLNGAATVKDNLIDNLDPDSGHGDGIQAEEGPNVIIRHNTISAGNTSSILVNDGTDENNWVIDNNLFTWAAHNNYVIHFRDASCPANNCFFINNVVDPFPSDGDRKVANAWATPDAQHWYGNRFSDTGAIIPIPSQ